MSPDTLAALAATVRDQWGEYGYSIVALPSAGAVHVTHADGSRFVVAVDRWGCHYTHATDHPYHAAGTDNSARIAARTIRAALEAHELRTPTRTAAEYHPPADYYNDDDAPDR